MRKSDIDLKKLPDTPGVYRFIGPKREVLYVGKATSLRDRIKSYFGKDLAEVRSPLIVKIVTDAVRVEVDTTDSVLEALILEASLIKKYAPLGNTDGKDDKSWNHLVITNEQFPRVLVVRGRNLEDFARRTKIHKSFGPYPHGGQLKEALHIVRKIFPFFDTPFPAGGELTASQEKTLRFNQSIGVYPPERDEKEYTKTIRAIVDLFSAKKMTLLKRLEKEMHRYAKGKYFEKAEERKRQMFALRHIQDVSLIKEGLRRPMGSEFRVEAYDTAHIQGSAAKGVMAVIVDGESQPSEYRTFSIRSAKAGDDYAALDEIIQRRAKHPEWAYPKLVVIDGGKAHLARAKKTLKDSGMGAEVVAVVKDEKHRPREILGGGNITITHETEILLANAEAHRFAISKHRALMRKRLFRLSTET